MIITMVNFNNLLNELGFELNENKLNKFLENSGIRNNIMKSDTIKGAFSKLSDEDKQSVINSLNQTQDFFDGLFGTKSKKWTIEDLDGAYVNVQTSGRGNDKDDCGCEERKDDCNKNNCTCGNGKKYDNTPKDEPSNQNTYAGSVASALRAEVEKQKQAELNELVDSIVKKAVEKFTNKKAHNYVVEENANGVVEAHTFVKLLQNDAHELSCNQDFLTKLKKALVEKTGAKSAAVYYSDRNEPDGNYLKIVITL